MTNWYISQPLAEPTRLGVPATEGVLTEVGVRDCCLGVPLGVPFGVPFGVPLGERRSSCWTGVLGGLIGLDIVDRDHNNLTLYFGFFQTRTRPEIRSAYTSNLANRSISRANAASDPPRGRRAWTNVYSLSSPCRAHVSYILFALSPATSWSTRAVTAEQEVAAGGVPLRGVVHDTVGECRLYVDARDWPARRSYRRSPGGCRATVESPSARVRDRIDGPDLSDDTRLLSRDVSTTSVFHARSPVILTARSRPGRSHSFAQPPWVTLSWGRVFTSVREALCSLASRKIFLGNKTICITQRACSREIYIWYYIMH